MTKNLTPRGIMPMKGIFVSRLVENGLAASTNLLAINDEIIEVNGIEVLLFFIFYILFFCL